MAQQIQAPTTVVIEGDQTAFETQDDFYGSALGLLRIATVLLSLAMELGAGLALREAWKMLSQDSVNWENLRKERNQVHERMVALAAEVTRLQDEAPLFVARFWRDFYGSMLTHTIRSAMTKLLVLLAGVVFIPHARAATIPHLNLVVAIDLTKSVDVKGPDGTTEFQKNIDGVIRILAQVPAGAHVSIIGITDHSFARPYILLSATVPNDAGYFGERLSSARKELVRVWKLRSAHLRPSFTSTDILGVLLLASHIFSQHSINGDEKILVAFSDMRNHATDLDLEAAASAFHRLVTDNASGAAPADLHRVRVFVLGADGAGQTTTYWQSLELFWKEYLSRSGALLESFSPLRELPIDYAVR